MRTLQLRTPRMTGTMGRVALARATLLVWPAAVRSEHRRASRSTRDRGRSSAGVRSQLPRRDPSGPPALDADRRHLAPRLTDLRDNWAGGRSSARSWRTGSHRDPAGRPGGDIRAAAATLASVADRMIGTAAPPSVRARGRTAGGWPGVAAYVVIPSRPPVSALASAFARISVSTSHSRRESRGAHPRWMPAEAEPRREAVLRRVRQRLALVTASPASTVSRLPSRILSCTNATDIHCFNL